MPRLQGAIFDMDGTLLDSMHMWRDLGPWLLQANGIEPDPDLREHVKTMTLREGSAYCQKTYHLPATAEEIERMFKEHIENFYRNEVEAKPGVKKFLSLMKMEGVWMYIATATERSLAEAALRHAGIDTFFRGMVTSYEVKKGKHDSAEIYEKAMRRLQSTKKDTVVFEDALHAVQTAKAAGFRVVGVYDPDSEQDQPEIQRLSDYYIRSFDEMFEERSLL